MADAHKFNVLPTTTHPHQRSISRHRGF